MYSDKARSKIPLLPKFSDLVYNPLEMSRSQFDQLYSAIARPDCLRNVEYYHPPHLYNELVRSQVVQPFLTLQHWENRKTFRLMVKTIRRTVGEFDVTVSVVHERTTFVKHDTGFPYTETPRCVLLDAHVLLSKETFHLADASQDWRTCRSPFVIGPPHIKFYCGIKLVSSSGVPIGVLAVFSKSPKKIPPAKIEILSKCAKRFMEHLETPYDVVESEHSKTLLNLYSKSDAELIELSARLGRATSTGGRLAIFEKDGSGSAYSGNRIYHLSLNFPLSRTRHFLPDTLAREFTLKVERLANNRDVLTMLSQSIQHYEKLDFVCIVGVRITSETLSDEKRAKVSKGPLSKAEMNNLAHPGNLKARVLGQSSEDINILHPYDEVWHRTSLSEHGYVMASSRGKSHFASGMTMTVSGPEVKVYQTKRSELEKPEYSARYSAVLLGAFSQSQDVFTSLKISRIHDHVKVYLAASSKA